MIKNWNYHNLYMDYSSYTNSNEHPSDIDMFYIGKNNFLIVGEIKNELGRLEKGQRKLYKQLIDGWKYDGVALFIIHDKYVQNGDKKVDVPNCEIREYYYKGKWYIPKNKIKVKDILNKYIIEEKKMEILSNREEMIFRNEYNGKSSYTLGLSKKDKEGNYINGYINVSFKKGVELQNKTKIKIKSAWLDFYKKDKITIPTIFINDFEIVEEIPINQLTTKTDFDKKGQIQISDSDIPF